MEYELFDTAAEPGTVYYYSIWTGYLDWQTGEFVETEWNNPVLIGGEEQMRVDMVGLMDGGGRSFESGRIWGQIKWQNNVRY
jgi:hypothetical protein